MNYSPSNKLLKFAAKSSSHRNGAHASAFARGAANIVRRRGQNPCQTFASTLPVGETGRTHLRSISNAMPALRQPNRRGGHPLIFFVNDGAGIRKILDHIGVESTPPKISQAHDPPLWDAGDEAEPKEYFDAAPDVDVGQYGPDEDVDQSVNW